MYAGSERNTGGFLLSAHSICVFSSTGFDHFMTIIIGFAVDITVCVCCSVNTVLRNVMQTFFFFSLSFIYDYNV